MGRFEFDPSWVIIRCLAGVGLAKITGVPVKIPRSRMRASSEPVRGQYWKQ
jgi:fatty-acid desaturase